MAGSLARLIATQVVGEHLNALISYLALTSERDVVIKAYVEAYRPGSDDAIKRWLSRTEIASSGLVALMLHDVIKQRHAVDARLEHLEVFDELMLETSEGWTNYLTIRTAEDLELARKLISGEYVLGHPIGKYSVRSTL